MDYLIENNITPKYTLKFIITVHEEEGFGASYIPEVNELLAVDMGCVGEDLDGSEYKVVPKITTPPKPKQEVKKEQPKEENKQATLFDFFDNPTPTEEKIEEIETVEELEEETMQEEIVDIPIEENKKENLIIDMETGEILTQNEQISSFDDEVTTSLFSIFQNILEVK